MNEKKQDIDSDYGILSMDEGSKLFNSATTVNKQCDNWVAPKLKSLPITQQSSSHFKIMVCGDSGIGKSALVQALTTVVEERSNVKNSYTPIEVFIPETDTCIVDTCGYGASIRAEVIFSHVKSYIEHQFEKTNSIFNPNYGNDDNLTYMTFQASDILTHVDVCLYLIMGRLKQVDIEYMRSIHHLVNIIPVIIQPDLSLRPEWRIEQKLAILQTLSDHHVKIALLGYEDYEHLIDSCKQPHCPPFMLDWSTTKHKRTFHGLLPLKQSLFQYQNRPLKYITTQKFIHWRSTRNISASSSSLSLVSPNSSQEHLKNIRISQYVTERRHSLKTEMLNQEQKLIQEFEISSKQRRTALILKELQLLVNQELVHPPMTHSPNLIIHVFLSNDILIKWR
ncbi:hypothetical protein INT47_004499 [Mucor saturninus]|uniref:Septin-type G domain-containing protein n=1 Tax=Mucor saturninus TaxID=64648 RepID=A0A8H7RLF4_9FUNG|nr:hypothetical protein INT47_004499 [Mucor saturninus]